MIEKVEVDFDNTHFLQYNAFADILGKKCVCGRPMKLQWGRNVSVPGPADFYWGCTGWYVPQGQGRACQRTQRLQREDYGLMTDTSAPEFSMTAEEFGEIITNPSTEKIIAARVKDLRSDLAQSTWCCGKRATRPACWMRISWLVRIGSRATRAARSSRS